MEEDGGNSHDLFKVCPRRTEELPVIGRSVEDGLHLANKWNILLLLLLLLLFTTTTTPPPPPPVCGVQRGLNVLRR
jgi:hypothetical protein